MKLAAGSESWVADRSQTPKPLAFRLLEKFFAAVLGHFCD